MKNVLKSLEILSTSFAIANEEIARYQHENNADINNVPGFCESYPFEKSFDEYSLSIKNWIDTIESSCATKTIEEAKYNRLQNIAYNIFTLLDEEWNGTLDELCEQLGTTPLELEAFGIISYSIPNDNEIKSEELFNYVCDNFIINGETKILVRNIIDWTLTQPMSNEEIISALETMLDGIGVLRKEIEKIFSYYGQGE